MKKISKIFSLLLPILFLTMSALAIEINNFEDFSSRSIIINQQKSFLTQEQKDVLISKKLTPTIACLIQQIKKNNIENVNLLLETGVNPNQNYMTEYPIYIAAKENNFEILKLLYTKGAKIDKGFYSELYEAVKNKNSNMAQFLLDKKANINYVDTITENSILYLTLKNNMLQIAQQLIAQGARPDRKSILYIKKKKLFYLIQNEI
ncbi:MAG: ankyrin repeat domain-containing protein [Candidatus Gastranaerophilales bacterium]|nr:ankyrin repeat domain-containing protein [Candidatus Gastranaerophilales bacterium]